MTHDGIQGVRIDLAIARSIPGRSITWAVDPWVVDPWVVDPWAVDQGVLGLFVLIAARRHGRARSCRGKLWTIAS